MKCKDFKAILSDYIDDNLSYDEKQEMDEHIRVCKSCAEIYERKHLTNSRLSDIFGEKHFISSDLTENVMSQIDGNYYKKTLKFRIKKHAALYAFASILIICIFASMQLIKSPSFKNFIASFKDQQINTNKDLNKAADNTDTKPIDDNSTNSTDENPKNNTNNNNAVSNDNNVDNTKTDNSAFRVIIDCPKISENVFVYEPLSNKKLLTLNYEAVNHDWSESYNIIGDRVYVFKQAPESDTLGWSFSYISFDGKVTSLNFIKKYSNYLLYSFISSDNKQIIWSGYNKFTYDSTINCTVYTADIDGSNVKKLYSKNEERNNIHDIKLSNDNKSIYRTSKDYLYKIDLSTGNETIIMNLSTIGKPDHGILGMSDDDSVIAYCKNKQIIIHNINTSSERKYKIPEINGYYGAEDVKFSPDGKYIVYTVRADIDNNTDIASIYVLLDLSTGQSQIIK